MMVMVNVVARVIAKNRNEKTVKAKRSLIIIIVNIITAVDKGMKRSCERNYHRRNSRSGRNSLCRRITEQNEETYYIESHRASASYE